jgi:DsbC/DsbD-like thiol-disulfide interchange protein
VLRIATTLLLTASLAFAADPAVVESKHLKVRLSQAPAASKAGKKLRLTAEIELAPGMHVYAPGVEKPYLPILITFPAKQDKVTIGPVKFPAAKKVHLPAIDETVPVYSGTFPLSFDVTLKDPSSPAEITAELKYQTCDDRICYRPVTLPLTWHIEPAR